MSGSLRSRPRRSKGSSIPRIAGAGVVVLLAAGGLAAYASSHHGAPPRHRQAMLSTRVLKAQTVGLIGYGPADDGDQFQPGSDDLPLMLQPTGARVYFITIPRQELGNGTPEWTADQMADGSAIFIYAPTGQCLTAAGHDVLLEHCNLQLGQRWRAVHAMAEQGQAFAAYAGEKAGLCLTTPPIAPEGQPASPGPAALTACGPARDKRQEIAFWWGP
jgi:hypothetical protein